MGVDAFMGGGVLGLALVLLAGLNAPMALLALGLLSAAGVALQVQPAWLAGPHMLWVWSAILVLQFLADLYFVPATVQDSGYLHPTRLVNAHLHARLQSFLRPFVAALVLAAIPLPIPAQIAAIAGFVGGTAIYWTTAWVREHVAMRRGSVFLLLVEMTKNVVCLCVGVLLGWMPLMALLVLGAVLAPIGLWSARLRREQLLYPAYGGPRAPEDS